jgi:hypothetical protein
MTYVEWEVFVWAIGFILTVSGIAIKYLMGRINDIKTMVDDAKSESKVLDGRVDIIEACHTETQVNIAKINKDIEYIRLSIDELLNRK